MAGTTIPFDSRKFLIRVLSSFRSASESPSMRDPSPPAGGFICSPLPIISSRSCGIIPPDPSIRGGRDIIDPDPSPRGGRDIIPPDPSVLGGRVIPLPSIIGGRTLLSFFPPLIIRESPLIGSFPIDSRSTIWMRYCGTWFCPAIIPFGPVPSAANTDIGRILAVARSTKSFFIWKNKNIKISSKGKRGLVYQEDTILQKLYRVFIFLFSIFSEKDISSSVPLEVYPTYFEKIAQCFAFYGFSIWWLHIQSEYQGLGPLWVLRQPTISDARSDWISIQYFSFFHWKIGATSYPFSGERCNTIFCTKQIIPSSENGEGFSILYTLFILFMTKK